MIFFATKKGYVKLVSGVEFETNRSLLLATKLEDGDELIGVSLLAASEILSHTLRVYLITAKKNGLCYSLDEVVEMKKGGRGVKGITLAQGDEVRYSAAVMPEIKEMEFGGEVYNLGKLKVRKRAAKAEKMK